MGQIKLGAIALVSSCLTIGAAIAAPTPSNGKPPQLVAQAESECRGQQILQARACAGDGTDREERKLHQLVNQYRAQNGLPAIPLSPSLSLVANRHVRDLEENIGQLTHGWSNCPYSGNNRSTWPCMWEAPQRLGTPYPGNGYENAHGGRGGYRASADSALRGWQGSSAHNAVILNQGIWENRPWNALGIGIYKGYAVLWFGEEPDPLNTSGYFNPEPKDNIGDLKAARNLALLSFAQQQAAEIPPESAESIELAQNRCSLSSLEREIIEETNRVRSNPAAYAGELENLRRYYNGNLFEMPGRIRIRTDEGVAALNEAIRYLRSASSLPPLAPSCGLSLGARDHVNDQGPIGGRGHTGRDGSDIAERIERYGTARGWKGENISYGKGTAADVVRRLIVDDGVPSRGHRNNIFNSDFQLTGVACGEHARYEIMCVITYAEGYQEGTNQSSQRQQSQRQETAACPLTGNWNYRQDRGWEYWQGQGFVGEEHIDSPDAFYSTTLFLKETPRQIETSAFVPNQNGGVGSLQGDILSLSLPVDNGAAQLVGRVSSDRNTIQGNITFVDGKQESRQVTIPFAMQRAGACGSQSEPARNSNPQSPTRPGWNW